MSNQKLKFSRGLEEELPTKYSDGEIRFCTDTGALFIDNTTGRTKITAGKADKADKLTTARVITLAGDVTGSVSFDGSKAVTITTTVKDDSHNHIINNIDGLQSILDAKAPIEFSANYTNKKSWVAVTKVGSYSRLCQVTGYGNFLFSITLSQNRQVSMYTFAVGFGWQSAEIHCIASTGYSANANQILRITRPSDSDNIYYIEILNNFSHDSAITKNCTCTINELQGSELIVVSYTDYTATDETHIEEASCETQYNGIVAPNFYGNATSSTTATIATKLNTSAGSTTQPVYFKDGKPVATTYALNKTVPADAKFTDTTYNNFVKSGSGSKAGLVPAPPTTAGTTKYLREDGTWAVPPNTTYSLASFGITASATELNYTKGVTSSIQTQLNNKLNLTGGSLTGAVLINRTAANKTSPSHQDLVINYTLSSGDSLTEKNAPGIGFHISNKSQANFIYDGKFKFVNNDFTDYVSVQASSFIGNLTGTASKATADANGNNIINTYATKAVATTTSNGLMKAEDKFRLDAVAYPSSYYLGSFEGKTIANMQTALDNWLEKYANISNATTFLNMSPDWITLWNNEDTTTAIPAGGRWTVTVIAIYDNNSWVQLRISYYEDKRVYYICKARGVWQKVHEAIQSIATSSKPGIIKSGGDIEVNSTTGAVTIKKAENAITANSATTAAQLTTGRTITLDTGVTSTATTFNGSKNISIPVTEVKEAYLSWGGKNRTGDFGPVDAAMVPDLGANRFAFMPANSITFEYSRDGGNTWLIYDTTNANKINFFNGNKTDYYIGASSDKNIDKSAYMLRVTIETSTANIYTTLRKFIILCTTSGSTGCYCTITARTQANYTSGTDTWDTFANKAALLGWSGYNVINIDSLTTYGNQTTHYRQIRFTFGVTGHAATVEYPGLTINKIMGFGGVGHKTPSTLATNGHLYTYDADKNVTFPAKVTATTFVGNLSGNASTATKATKLGDSTIGSTSQPIYLNAGTATKISAVGTAYGGTGATTVAGARTNLEVYSKTEVDNKLTEKSSTTHRHTVAHTPAGTISQPTFTGSEVNSGTPSETISVYSITGVGSAPSLTASVSNRCLVFSWKAGSVPTRSSVAVASSGHKHKVTASGTVSKPTFTGTAATLTTSTPI